MRKVGNVVSNQIYNAENRRPPVPVDVDEADSAMERFIRQKYITSVTQSAGKPRSPRSEEGTPPPLPPKNTTKFGLRSASSLFPLSSRAKKEKQAAALELRRPSSESSSHKPAKVFGATLNYDDPEATDRKLARLQDMGFNDIQRNSIVLKGVNGNLERAVESLVRLGEGGKSPAPIATAAGSSWQPPPRSSSTPATPGSVGGPIGLGVQRSTQDQPATPSSVSTNPFDMMPPAQPQTAQSTGTLQNNNPYHTNQNKNWNPFGQPQQANDAFAQAFQNMNLSPQQPLFPHHTGGTAPPQNQQQQFYQPQRAPSAPTSPYFQQPMSFQNNMSYPQPSPIQPQTTQPQAFQPQATGYNPFMQLSLIHI